MQCVNVCLTSGSDLSLLFPLLTSCNSLSILSFLISCIELQLLFALAPPALDSMASAASQHEHISIASLVMVAVKALCSKLGLF